MSVAAALQAIALAFVCIGVAGYGVLTAWIAPLSARLYYDPSMQYMLSSLSPFRGQTYAYYDHPGTPVELLGTLLLGLSYPFAGSAPEGFVNFHLGHPQAFLSTAQTLLVIASIGVCWLFARKSLVARHWSQGLVAIALGASFFTLLPGAFASLAIWSHESFCFPAGTLLSLALLVAVRRAGGPSWRWILGLGFAAGVLTSIQLYFAAWVVGTAVGVWVAALFQGASPWKAGWRGVGVPAMAGLGFIVATLPIVPHYRQFAGWVMLLITHQGTYGSGAAGLPSPRALGSGLVALVLDAPTLFAACAIGVLILGWRLWRGRRAPALQPLASVAGIGFVAQLVVLLLMVSKHPGERYLLPIAATAPLVFVSALDGLDVSRALVRHTLAAIGVAVLAMFAVSLGTSVGVHQSLADDLRRQDAAIEATLNRVADERGVSRSALNTLWTYGTPSPCYALWFGDDSANRLFFDDIARMCPHDANLNVWSAQVATSRSDDLALAQFHDWDVTAIPEALARTQPQALPAGRVYPSSIASPGYGQLLFIARAAS